MQFQTGLSLLVIAGSTVLLSACTLTDGLRGLWGEENSTEQTEVMGREPRRVAPVVEQKPVDSEQAESDQTESAQGSTITPAATGESAFDAALDAAQKETSGSLVAPTLPSNL